MTTLKKACELETEIQDLVSKLNEAISKASLSQVIVELNTWERRVSMDTPIATYLAADVKITPSKLESGDAPSN